MPESNVLYYGDNLDIVKRYIKDETIDLVYLDPPFKSMQDYNVLFQERNGSQAAAQVKAFEDTWVWDMAAASAYHDIVEQGGRVADVLVAFQTFLGNNDMLAYLSIMAPRDDREEGLEQNREGDPVYFAFFLRQARIALFYLGF